MKKVIGFLILILVLVAVSGCTQQTKTAPVTTTVPTAAPTVIATTVATTVETTAAPTDNSTAAVAPAITVMAGNITTPVQTAEVPTATQTVSMSVTPTTRDTVIHIANNTYTPSVLVVLPGTGVTWKNDDKIIHSIKLTGNNSGMFNSGDIYPGATYMYTFSGNVGPYQYTDGYNTNMTGTVVLQNGADLFSSTTLVAMSVQTNSS